MVYVALRSAQVKVEEGTLAATAATADLRGVGGPVGQASGAPTTGEGGDECEENGSSVV